MTTARTQGSTGKANFATGRWKSASTQGSESRKAPAPVEPGPDKPVQPQTLSERLPVMSDIELTSLLANAQRVAQDDKSRKQGEAADLLPLIAEEQARRAVEKAASTVEKKKTAATKRASTRAAKLVEKAAMDEDADDEE